MNLRYIILEKTPFPSRFIPLAHCFLQDAELHTRMNRTRYHERAQRLGTHRSDGTPLTYSQADALRIVEYRQKTAPYAEHLLLAVPAIV